jgi:hypothetical protein
MLLGSGGEPARFSYYLFVIFNGGGVEVLIVWQAR